MTVPQAAALKILRDATTIPAVLSVQVMQDANGTIEEQVMIGATSR